MKTTRNDGGGSATEVNSNNQWVQITASKKTNHKNKTLTKAAPYIALSNAYATLPQYAADPPPLDESNTPKTNKQIQRFASKFKRKAERRFLARQAKRDQAAADDEFLDQQITWAEDERTDMAKNNINDKRRTTIDQHHCIRKSKPTSILQTSRNFGYAFATGIKRAVQATLPAHRHVHFANKVQQ